MFDISTEAILFLIVAAFAAGFVDSIAGGGGLITVPAMLLAGLSPVETIATNKVGGTFGAASATWSYASKGLIDFRSQLPWAILSAAGGAIGASLAALIPGDLLRAALPVILVVIALYFALKPNMDDIDRKSRMSAFLFGATIVPAIGFYDGVFGPGTGSFFMLGLVALLGYGVLKATAHTKLLNLSSNVGSLLVFIFAGAIVWQVGLLMGLAQFAGARLGSGMAMRNGAKLIKPLLVTVCVVLAVRLMLDPSNPLRTALGF